MNAAVTQVMTPMDLCNLITHETVALLYGADGDGIDTAEELRDAMKVYAAACGLEDDVSVHLAWIDSELASARQFKKVGEIIWSDKSRRYVVPSAPGKRNDKDEKVTDLLYQCYDAASQGRSYKKILEKIKNRY